MISCITKCFNFIVAKQFLNVKYPYQSKQFWKSKSKMTVCYYHLTYPFQSESTLYNYLNVRELLAGNRGDIWSLSDCIRTWTHNHLVRKRTLKYLAKLAILAKWLSVRLRTKWLRVRLPLQSLKSKISSFLPLFLTQSEFVAIFIIHFYFK